jgi:hypothetical protein
MHYYGRRTTGGRDRWQPVMPARYWTTSAVLPRRTPHGPSASWPSTSLQLPHRRQLRRRLHSVNRSRQTRPALHRAEPGPSLEAACSPPPPPRTLTQKPLAARQRRSEYGPLQGIASLVACVGSGLPDFPPPPISPTRSWRVRIAMRRLGMWRFRYNRGWRPTRQGTLSRDHQGPRAILNALERIATGYGSDIVRVRHSDWGCVSFTFVKVTGLWPLVRTPSTRSGIRKNSVDTLVGILANSPTAG